MTNWCKWISFLSVCETYCKWQTHKDRLWRERRFELVQLGWTDPNALPKHVAPNFTKSQMVSILSYINGWLCICFSLALPSGWGMWGRQGQAMPNSKWAKSIWIWLCADYRVCCSVVLKVSGAFCILGKSRGKMTFWLRLPMSCNELSCSSKFLLYSDSI